MTVKQCGFTEPRQGEANRTWRAAILTSPWRGEVAERSEAGGGDVMAARRLPINNFRRANARRLRTNATDTEMRLWKRLRTIPTFGTHFRRQVPIGPYI